MKKVILKKAGNRKLQGADKIYLYEMKKIIEFVKQHRINVKNMQLVFSNCSKITYIS